MHSRINQKSYVAMEKGEANEVNRVKQVELQLQTRDEHAI